jgi:aminomethyltransferase
MATTDATQAAGGLKHTPCWEQHKALGGKMVPFAGYEMPVQYPAGITAEHHAVRTGVGLFDVSHMGEFEITGPDRNAFVNRVTCNDVSALEPGQVQYSAILTPEGTFVDDCTVYRFDDKLMIVVNASNREKAWKHIVDQKGGINVRLRDISDDIGLLALQGPKAEATAQGLTGTNLADLPYYHHAQDTAKLWDALVAAGAQPIGLGARDSLRLEMAYALYGNEIDDTITPLEAGLAWIVKLDKGAPFTGEEALRRQKEHGVTRRMVGFRLL